MAEPRHVTLVAATISAALGVGMQAHAQTAPQFPSKPVRLVVGFSPGSQSDILARILGPKLSETWRQPVIIENRPGATGQIGASIVAKASPDGHTLLFTSASFVINAALQSSLPYDPLKDFAGVTQLGFTTGVLVVSPALGARSVRDLVALAQQRPGKLIFGSTGVGSNTHLSGETFRMAAGVQVTHVGFKGQPEFLIEIMAGRIHFAVPGLASALPLIKDGRLLPLAVGTPQRSPVLPGVPTIAEVLPKYEKDGSYALLAPARTPRPVLQGISKDVARALADREVLEKLNAIGFIPAPTTPEEHDQILRAQINTFSGVVRLIGLRQ